MEISAVQAIPVRDPTDVAAARRGAVGMAGKLGYKDSDTGRVAIVVTELAQNLLRHAGGGEILVGPDPRYRDRFEIMALDRGPGMADVAACLRDGFSTGGTSGNGLGAVQRLAHQLLIDSRPGSGTALLVRMGREADAADDVARTTATLAVPKPGEQVCGDAGAIVTRQDGNLAVLLADGLGHGPIAAAASEEAVRLFKKAAAGTTDSLTPGGLLPVLHAGLRPTRGAALAVACIDPAARRVLYGGVGNIAGFIIDSAGLRRMVSHNGIAGHAMGRLQAFQYPLYHRPVLVLYSDGLATSWSPENYPDLFTKDPTLIAGVLYRAHARGRDDASVLVWKG
jgi:anti-sigma regulatory factor (Ser/Thr protein kinase)